MKQFIDGDKLCLYDGIAKIFTETKIITKYLNEGYDKPISLNDCLELINDKTDSLTVIFEDALKGKIYIYGNHGDYWEEIGSTIGYA